MNANQERGEVTRRNILDVALRLFSENGYHATSIEVILSATGISRGAFYHHFKNKEQLFEAVFLLVEQQVTLQTIEHVQQISDPEERLRAGCRRFIEIASQSPFRQVGLIDAPTVLGWQRWRDLEEQYGLGVLRAGLNAVAEARGESREVSHEGPRLLLAALIEATMIVARSNEPAQAAAGCEATIQRILTAVVNAS